MWIVRDDTEEVLVALCTTKDLAVSIAKSYLERVASDSYNDLLDREERGTDTLTILGEMDMQVWEVETDKDLTT